MTLENCKNYAILSSTYNPEERYGIYHTQKSDRSSKKR